MDRTLGRPQLLWVLCWTLLISGSALIALTVWQSLTEKRPDDNRYQIRAIVQPQERLPADQIAGLLGMTTETNLYTLELKEAEARLESYPLIRSAKVARLPPDAFYVDLTLRTPIAKIDGTRALDADGVVFPYMGSENLPTVRLGGDTKTVHHLLQLIPGALSIDLSRQHHPRYGLREIVIETEEGSLLRLPPSRYEEALKTYSYLHVTRPLIVDLRIPSCAYYQQRNL